MFIANTKTKQIHRAGCSWARLISKNNRHEYPTLEPALANGYDGCRFCLGQFDGYKRERGTWKKGDQVAEKLGYDVSDLSNAYVTYQEGVNAVITPAIALKSFFPFTGQSLKDEDGKVEGSGENLQFLEKVGSEKNVYDFSADEAVMKLPVNCPVENGMFFTIRFMLPSGKKKAPDNKKILLLRGPGKVPVRVYLHTAGGKFTVSISLETTAGIMTCKGDSYPFTEDDWHTLTGVYTPAELDLIADGKQCIARRILPEQTPMEETLNSFIIGYDPKEEAMQYQGYVSTFEYDSGVKQKDADLVEKAAQAGLGAIDSFYGDMEDKASLGKMVKEGSLEGGGLYREYQKGAIYWSRVTGAACVKGYMWARYKEYGGPSGVLGYPWWNEMTGRTAWVTFQVFQGGAIYHKISEKGASYGGGITNKPMGKYLELGMDACGFGVPDPACNNLKDQKHPFDEKLEGDFYRIRILDINDKGQFLDSWIYYSDDTEPVLMPYGPLTRYYDDKGIMKKFGYPLADRVLLNGRNAEYKNYCMKFQNGEFFWTENQNSAYPLTPVFLPNVDFLDAYHGNGGYGKLGMPVSFNEPRNFCDCDKGTLVRHSGKVYFITEIEFNLESAVAYAIDDGVEWLGKDTTPELSYYLTLQAENDRVKTNDQLVNIQSEYSRSKTSKKRTFPAACKFRMKIRGNSTIFFHIKYVDWDAASKNDYLGSVERTLNAENLWMLDDTVIRPGYPMEGIYELPLDHYGNDAKKNKYNTVKTTFTVRQTDGEVYALNPDAFRSRDWWAFENFSNSRPLSRSFVTSVFKDMDYVQSDWDRIRNPLDSAFYAAAKYAGTQGNCFGMCLGAIEAYYGKCALSMPVSKYKANDRDAMQPNGSDDIYPVLREYLQACQLRQFSLASVRHIVNQFVKRNIQKPTAVFRDVENEIRKSGFSMVTMVNAIHGFKAHVVLAYKTETRKSDGKKIIYTADPNFSSRRSVNNQNDINWIEIDPQKETFQYVKPDLSKANSLIYDPVYRTSTNQNLNNWKLGRFDGLMFSTSYWTVAGTPYTPSWYLVGLAVAFLTTLGILGPLVGGMAILGFIGLIGSVDCVEVDCDGKAATLDNNGIIPLTIPSGDGDHCQFFLVTKPASSYSIRVNGRVSGEVTQILETSRGIYSVKTDIKQGETTVVSVNQEKELSAELSVSGIMSRLVTLEIREKPLGARKEAAERAEMRTGISGKAVLKLDRLSSGTSVRGADQGLIFLMKQLRKNSKELEVTRLNLTAGGEKEEIRVIRTKPLSLNNILVERVDTGTQKVMSRDKYNFKKE